MAPGDRELLDIGIDIDGTKMEMANADHSMSLIQRELGGR